MEHMTPAELLEELVATVESPLSSRDDIRKVVRRLERVPLFRRAIKQDPIMEALDTLLLDVRPDANGVATLGGVLMTTKVLSEALGKAYADHSLITRIGRRLSRLGFARVQATRLLPARWRVPKEIG